MSDKNNNNGASMFAPAVVVPVLDESEKITIDQFVRVLPKQVKTKVTADMVDTINNLIEDPKLREQYRDNLLSYTGVMADGKFKIQSYVDAVRYVSYKLMGASNIEAYTKTFPNRFQRLMNEGADDKTISSYVAAYNKTILVNMIMEQTLVPMHVLNADYYQKAINVQAELMVTANSEKVRTDAANSLLVHLKAPETTKIELGIEVKQSKAIDDLRDATLELVKKQRDLLASGEVHIKEIAHSTIVSKDTTNAEGANDDGILEGDFEKIQ